MVDIESKFVKSDNTGTEYKISSYTKKIVNLIR